MVLSLEIITEKMEIVMDFEAVLRWTDPRLVFRDLKMDQATNALQPHDLQKLWVPQVRSRQQVLDIFFLDAKETGKEQ